MPNKGKRKHSNSKEVIIIINNDDGEKYSNNIITKNYITREHKD
jgi:hypothetical protein